MIYGHEPAGYWDDAPEHAPECVCSATGPCAYHYVERLKQEREAKRATRLQVATLPTDEHEYDAPWTCGNCGRSLDEGLGDFREAVERHVARFPRCRGYTGGDR